MAVKNLALAVDFETTGLPNKFDDDGAPVDIQGIQLGAAVVNLDTLEVVDTYLSSVQYEPQYQWSKYAEAVHGLSVQSLAVEKPMAEAAGEFMAWVADHFGARKLTLIAYNLPFDTAFLHQWAKAAGTKIAINHRYIDAMCFAPIVDGVWKSDDAFKTLNVERGAHNALEDVLLTVQYLKRVRDLAGAMKEELPPVDR